MGRRGLRAAAATAVLLPLAVALLRGVFGSSWPAAVGAGVALMAAVATPAVAVLLWGRDRSHNAFLGTVAGTMLGKLAVVGAGLAYVLAARTLPPGPFVAGLLAAWIVSFVVLSLVLRATLARGRA